MSLRARLLAVVASRSPRSCLVVAERRDVPVARARSSSTASTAARRGAARRRDRARRSSTARRARRRRAARAIGDRQRRAVYDRCRAPTGGDALGRRSACARRHVTLPQTDLPATARPPLQPARPVHGRRRRAAARASACGSSRSRRRGQLLVVAAPLDEVDDDAAPLLLVELAVAAVGARWRRRCSASGSCASACARSAGSRRPPARSPAATLAGASTSDDPRTEVGRLGARAQHDARPDRGRLRRARPPPRTGCAASSPTRRTSCARRSPPCAAYAELFDRGARERPEDLERVDDGIQRESARMGAARRGPAAARPARPGPAARAQAGRARRRGGRGGRRSARVDPAGRSSSTRPAPVEVIGDATRLRQVVDNLLANVRAHTPAGTAATVRVLERRRLSAVIEVADDGPGLADEQLVACVRALLPGRRVAVTRRRRRRPRPGDRRGDRRVARRLGHGRQQGPERRARPDGSGRDPAGGSAPLQRFPTLRLQPARRRRSSSSLPVVPATRWFRSGAPRGDHLRRAQTLRSCCHSPSATLRGQMMLEPIGPTMFLPGLASRSPASVAT